MKFLRRILVLVSNRFTEETNFSMGLLEKGGVSKPSFAFGEHCFYNENKTFKSWLNLAHCNRHTVPFRYSLKP